MSKLLLLASLCAATATACTDSVDTLRIADAPGQLTIPRDSFAWSYTGGTATVTAPGTIVYPAPLSLKFDVQRSIDSHEVSQGIAMGSVEVVPGSACRITRAAQCDGRQCLAEIELTGVGVCMLRVRSTSTDGESFAQCWHSANWEAAPENTSATDWWFEFVDDQRASCDASL